MIGRIKCKVFGHADTTPVRSAPFIRHKCDRCGKTVDRERTERKKAIDALPRHLRETGQYEPVDRAEDADGTVVEPGDTFLYKTSSGFPGVSTTTQGTVEYLYETPGISQEIAYAAKVSWERDLVNERKWVAVRDEDDPFEPTPLFAPE